MSVMGFQKKVWMGVGGVSSIHSKFILDFLLFSDGNNIVNIRLRALKLSV